MKTRQLSLILLGAFAAATQTRAALLVYYSFDGLTPGTLADGSLIGNGGTGGPGTFDTGTNSGSGNVVTSGVPGGFGGNALSFTPTADGDGELSAPNIATGFSAAAAGVTGSTNYTAMAWVNFANTVGDNMIFGGGGTPVLHNGTRNGNLHTGHWGDDIGPDQGVTVQPGTGIWHHVAYTNNATNQEQSIYMDGNLVVGPGAGGNAGAMNTALELLIGTSGNGGSFNGILDEVRVYNTLLTQAEIQNVMNVVPEPGSAVVAGLVGFAGLMVRRRRASR